MTSKEKLIHRIEVIEDLLSFGHRRYGAGIGGFSPDIISFLKDEIKKSQIELYGINEALHKGE